VGTSLSEWSDLCRYLSGKERNTGQGRPRGDKIEPPDTDIPQQNICTKVNRADPYQNGHRTRDIGDVRHISRKSPIFSALYIVGEQMRHSPSICDQGRFAGCYAP